MEWSEHIFSHTVLGYDCPQNKAQNHRITELLRLEKTLKLIKSKIRLSWAPSNLALNSSRVGAPNLSGHPVPVPHHLRSKTFLPNLHFPSFCLKSHLVLSLSDQYHHSIIEGHQISETCSALGKAMLTVLDHVHI